VTIGLTFVFMSIFNESVNKARMDYALEVNLAADRDNWIYRIWPGYTLTDSLKTESLSSILDAASMHDDTSFYSDPWKLHNQLGCVLMNGVNCCFWLVVLIIIESCSCKRKPAPSLSQSSLAYKQQKN